MEYVTIRCPHCKRVMSTATNPVKVIGSPFEKCMYCGGVYLNSYKEEWITKSSISKFFFYLQIGSWARAIMLPAVVCAPLFGGLVENIVLMFVMWGVSSIAWLSVEYYLHKKNSRDSIKASLVRTQNAEYVELLKKFGFKIFPLTNNDTDSESVMVAINELNEAKSRNEVIKDNYIADDDYGLIKEKPIYVNGVNGSNEYLSKLTTDKGEDLIWKRMGSLSVDGIDGMVDKYNLYLLSDNVLYKTVFLNMYCLSNSENIPKGFSRKE